MASYSDLPYKLQDALSSYLTTNKATYASAVAASLPIVLGGDFGERGRDHVYLLCQDMREDPETTGTFIASVIVGVGTVRGTSLSTHRSYCKAIFDLLMDEDLTTYINAISGSKVRIFQVISFQQSIGAVTDAMRFMQLQFDVRVYQTT